MWQNALTIARDASVILLALEAFVALLASVALLWYVAKGLKRFRPLVAEYLGKVHDITRRVVETSARGMGYAAAPFIWIESVSSGVRAAIERVGALRKGR
jgi:hypothetical protein